ncbi:MAG: amidohydrolase family protein [Candidatus Lokiarchaeota archaeon]|nr:amidohydrolase family protein [Candidatus Lokiarchaeota archaeon]
MIIVKANNQVHRIYMVDAHSHVGYDVDSVNNPNPMAPFGTIDFYKKTYLEVIKMTGGAEWKFNSRGINYEFRIVPNPPVYEIFKQAAERVDQYKQMLEKLENSWMFDYGVCFPFQDKYRAENPEALYRASNERISQVVTKFPVSLKMIGYCRVHPDEGQKALDEIAHSVNVKGLRGLKLHPRSEQWLDHVNSQAAVNVLVQAAKFSLPVIFDTRGKESIYAIHDLTKATKAYLERSAPALVPHLKVIVGHCAAGNFDDARTYKAISDTNNYGELSMIRSPEFDQFIVDFMKKSPAGKSWSQHILFGSDFPYFFERHAKDIISFLLSKQFFDAGGTVEDIKNILGANLLRLLPDYSIPQRQTTAIPNPVAIHATGGSVKALESVSQVIVEAIDDPTVDITRIVPMYRDGYGNYRNEYLLGTRFTVNNEQKDVLMACINLVGDDVYALGPLGTDSTWNKFGFSYFDLEGMNALKGFTSINPVGKPEDAWKLIKTMFAEPKGGQKKLQPLRPPTKPMKGGAVPAGARPVKPMKPAGA